MDNTVDTSQLATSVKTLPELHLTGDLTGMSHEVYKNLSFDFKLNDGRDISGFAKIKWQGDGSLRWDKKSYKFKAYEDEACKTKLKIKPLADWAENSDFNLKANYMDITHARNITNAALFADMTATRQHVNDELAQAINFGEIQGFPIRLWINDKFNGVYTFNTGKNGTLLNMSKDNKNHAAVEAAQFNDTTAFKADTAKFDNSDFSVEFPDALSDPLKNSFENLMKFAHNSSIFDFRAHQDEYINIESVIDFGIFANVIDDTDMEVKNAMYVTYDGTHWTMVPYDLDTSWQLQWDGKSLQPIDQDLFDFQGNQLLYKAFAANQDLVYKRYRELRQTVLRGDNVINHIKQFMQSVGEPNYENDLKTWPDLPSEKLTGMSQLQYDMSKRLALIDDQIERHFGGGQKLATPNFVKNSDFKYDLSDWKVYGNFYRTTFSTSVNNGSMGAGYSRTGIDEGVWNLIVSTPIPISNPDNPPVVSFGGKIMIPDDVPLAEDDTILISLHFLDANERRVNDGVTLVADHSQLNCQQFLKAEGIQIPKGTVNVHMEFAFNKNGHAILTQPQINFTPTLGEYVSGD